MSKINLLLTNANDNLTSLRPMLERIIRRAEVACVSKLRIEREIDVLVTNQIYEMIIPEDGVSGNTYSSNFIIINIDETKTTEAKIFELLCHELYHAARWQRNAEWVNCFFDLVIMEGLATVWQRTICNPQDMTFFMQTVTQRTKKESQKILQVLQPWLNKTEYDGRKLLVYPDPSLPRWSGYSLGYYLVKKYLKQHQILIEQACDLSYASFREVI